MGPLGRAQAFDGLELRAGWNVAVEFDGTEAERERCASTVGFADLSHLGKLEVRQLFNIPKAGTIAGSFVTEGKITRKAQLRLVRDSVVLYTGKVGSMRRFKDDVSEVSQGYECGLSIEGYSDLKEGDIIEAFEIETMAATLENPTGEGREGRRN